MSLPKGKEVLWTHFHLLSVVMF